MTKKRIAIIVFVLLLTITVVGSTYAFFTATVNSSGVDTSGSKFEVIYTGGTDIGGPISLSSQKVEESSTSVNIKIGQGSVKANATLYIKIEEISEVLAVPGFIWEVYGYKNSEQVYYKKGNFDGLNATNNNVVNIVENYQLTEENTEFKVYIWLDGNMVGNEVMNASFKGQIGAKTENFTGQLK